MDNVSIASNDDHGYTLSRAATLLNVSESTITRRLRDGDLDAVSGKGRGRVSAMSVRAARQELAAVLDMHINDGRCVDRAKHSDLVQKIIDQQAVIDDLRTAIASLNDALGRSTPRSPLSDR